ncbi:hypothetical protein ADUPG1_006710 [Aduncisulcus paluster]|uniref:Uncharacterized protein n=1 Tax=Aduncisulcus paluster TaxID=2918883 RepID=A0ABQ5KM55_9EUKA|nr:hypothetical protein ADUPG1_006710 [Aduncisulcus paluster]
MMNQQPLSCSSVEYTWDGTGYAVEFVPTPDLIPNKNPQTQNLQCENPGTQQDKVGDASSREAKSEAVSEEHRHETAIRGEEREEEDPASEAVTGDRERSKTEKEAEEEEVSVGADPKREKKMREKENLQPQKIRISCWTNPISYINWVKTRMRTQTVRVVHGVRCCGYFRREGG